MLADRIRAAILCTAMLCEFAGPVLAADVKHYSLGYDQPHPTGYGIGAEHDIAAGREPLEDPGPDTLPDPASVAPAATVTVLEAASEPFSTRVPPLTIVC